MGISLEELTSVKLRKVTRDENHESSHNNSSPVLVFGLKKCPSGKFVSPRCETDENKHPFITLNDIRKVSLRKTQANSGNRVKKR